MGRPASFPQWGLSWTYDRYGNRSAQTVTAGSGPSNAVTIDTATNRITNMGGSTFYYDSNGNLTQDDLYKYKLDAENRLVELRNLSNTLLASYGFDGNSIRVIKVAGSTRTWYLYAGTQLIGEFTDTATNTYSAGTLPGQAGPDSTATMLFQHGDHLTTRFTSDNFSNTGNQQAHYPYGETWYAIGTADPSVKRKFTSYYKEDEAATGKLNYAVFREQSARIGRFLMADPVRGKVGNPQRLNRYAYVAGNPVTRIDPQGLDFCADDPNCDRWVARIDDQGMAEHERAMLNLPFGFSGIVTGMPGGGGLDGGGGGGGIDVGGGSPITTCVEIGRVRLPTISSPSNRGQFLFARRGLSLWRFQYVQGSCMCVYSCVTTQMFRTYAQDNPYEVHYACTDGTRDWTERRTEMRTDFPTYTDFEPCNGTRFIKGIRTKAGCKCLPDYVGN